ncbi:Phospholipid/glycerol acyltransferase family protein [Euphorbia peplus]|nr:Phospholipid/glycerol acyltransferase family protein [Euphorbia peplus]
METELNPMPHAPPPPPPPPQPELPPEEIKDTRPLLKSDTTARIPTENIQELEKKFAAYVRNDVYGTMGCGELTWIEKVLLGLALVTLVPIRVVLATVILFLYYVICRICTVFSSPNRDEEEEQEDFAHMGGWRRAVIVSSGRFLGRAVLFVFGFYWVSVTDTNREEDKSTGENGSKDTSERPGAIISNHVSYIDILYHMSSSFPSFVAKRSVGKLPLIGLISKCLGCVYVQRESKSSDFKGVAGVVTERVREAHENEDAPMMMLFPEGTTTNGDYLLPFKTGAFVAGAPVLPVILRYPYQRFSPAWDSISGMRHVILLLSQFVNYMEVTQLPVYYPSQAEKDNPKLYASNVRRLMAKEGNLTMSDIGLAEKRIYHAALNGLF